MATATISSSPREGVTLPRPNATNNLITQTNYSFICASGMKVLTNVILRKVKLIVKDDQEYFLYCYQGYFRLYFRKNCHELKKETKNQAIFIAF